MLSSLAPLSLLLATLQVRAAPTQELPGAAASSGSSQQDEGNESSSYGTVSLDGDKSAKAIIASQDGKVSGTVTLKWLPDAGTAFSVDIQGLYDASAQYKWHIHEMPVSSDGDCSFTGSHLNPTGSKGDCNADTPWFCEEGDISGKHGTLTGSAEGSVSTEVTDAYVRWEPEAFSVLGRAITIHDANGDPYACGNISSILDGTANEKGEPNGSPSNYQTYPESDWPEPSDDNVGWTPSIQEAPQVVLSVSEDGKRTVVVGQLGDEGSTPDGNNKTSASEGDSMVSVDTDILSKLGYGQNNASGSGSNNTSDAVSLPTGSAGSQAGESETDGTSASISSSSTDSDAEPVQDDSSATQLQMMVGLALLPVTMALLGGNAV